MHLILTVTEPLSYIHNNLLYKLKFKLLAVGLILEQMTVIETDPATNTLTLGVVIDQGARSPLVNPTPAEVTNLAQFAVSQ